MYTITHQFNMSIDKEDFNMKINANNYVCSICVKRNVKLWRPCMDSAPLVCAQCAEKLQSPREYAEAIWSKIENGHFFAKFTGKRLPLPNWEVNEKGEIPTDIGPVPEEHPIPMTDQLLVDLLYVSSAHLFGKTSMIPAWPNEDGDFWAYNSVPEENRKLWEELPTR